MEVPIGLESFSLFLLLIRSEPFYGYLSMILMELPITTLHRRHMLLCAEWYVLGQMFREPFLT